MPPSKGTVFAGGASGQRSDHGGGALMNGISILTNETPEGSLRLPHERTQWSQPSASGKRASSEPDHRGTLMAFHDSQK